MKRLLVLLLSGCAAFVSCGVTTLYDWGGGGDVSNYERLAYKDYKTQTPEAVCKLLCLYEKMLTNPGGSRRMPPPGICAEYGYLLLLPGTADIFEKNATPAQRKMFPVTDDYGELFRKMGKEMLQHEIELYPESKVFIGPLIRKLAQ